MERGGGVKGGRGEVVWKKSPELKTIDIESASLPGHKRSASSHWSRESNLATNEIARFANDRLTTRLKFVLQFPAPG